MNKKECTELWHRVRQLKYTDHQSTETLKKYIEQAVNAVSKYSIKGGYSFDLDANLGMADKRGAKNFGIVQTSLASTVFKIIEFIPD